jgi:hypothetical protein
MILVHGTTDKRLNYWQDDSHVHLVQESLLDGGIYFYFRNHTTVDSGTPEELAQKFGFTLVGRFN